MFERTSVLGGIRLVCPYHAEKKQDTKNSWVMILGSVGVLISVGYLVCRNSNRSFSRFYSSRGGTPSHEDDDMSWSVHFPKEFGGGSLLKREGVLNQNSEVNQRFLGREMQVRSLHRRNAPTEGIPLDSYHSFEPVASGLFATAPPLTPEAEEAGGGITYRSTQSDYSVISVDRDPALREAGDGYVAVDARGVDNVWNGTLWGWMR